MPGRFAGPFNLFRGANARERLVKNYAAKLLANVERIVDRPGGSKFQKLVSQHGDLLFTAMVDKTGPRPLYRVFVTGVPLQVVTEEQVREIVVLYVFMESGFIKGVRGTLFEAKVYYTAELSADLAALSSGASDVSWLDWLSLELTSISRVYTEGMDSLAIVNTEKLSDFAGLFNYSTQSGKGLLLWQAQAGTNIVPRGSYNGPTIPE